MSEKKFNFNFTGKFIYGAFLSLALVAGSLFLVLTQLKYGVDFRGGAEVQIKFEKSVSLSELRDQLNASKFGGALVQSFGDIKNNEYLLKVSSQEKSLNEQTQRLSESLKRSFSSKGVEIRKVDIVGPKAGAQLRISGFQAMLWALVVIMIYIGLRFDFRYSPGAIVALFHDIMIILGVFSIIGLEFSLQVVAALLAVIGYSVNDTVIVYDRVRENEENHPNKALRENINKAINETLTRTILTSGTTLFISVSMLVFGGLAIKNFFLAITLGVIVGTYSSIFVAAPVTLFFDKFQKK